MHVVVKGFVTNMPEIMSASGKAAAGAGSAVHMTPLRCFCGCCVRKPGPCSDWTACKLHTGPLLLCASHHRPACSVPPLPSLAALACPAPLQHPPSVLPAADVIITKAGPGTISEALICGLPMVLNAYVPCQEEGNIPYVTDNGVRLAGLAPAVILRAALASTCMAGGYVVARRCSMRRRVPGRRLRPWGPALLLRRACGRGTLGTGASGRHAHITLVLVPQVGVFEKSPAKAAQLIKGWLGERRDEFEEMKRRAKALGKPHALFDICRDLATLAPAPGARRQPLPSLAAA